MLHVVAVCHLSLMPPTKLVPESAAERRVHSGVMRMCEDIVPSPVIDQTVALKDNVRLLECELTDR